MRFGRRVDMTTVSRVYHLALYNNSRDGTFANRAKELGLPHGAGMGVDFSDYDNDGDLDVYVSNLQRDFLLQNNGDGTFTDREDVGILNDTMAWGVKFIRPRQRRGRGSVRRQWRHDLAQTIQ